MALTLVEQIMQDEGVLSPAHTEGGEGQQNPEGGSQEGGDGDLEDPSTAGGGEGGEGTEGEGAGGKKPVAAPKEGEGVEAPKPKPKPASTAEAEAPQPMDDAALLEALRSRGIAAETLEDLKRPAVAPTEEELAAAEEKLRSDAIAYGLKARLFDSRQLEAYQADLARPDRDIAKEVFATQVKEAEPALTDEEIEDRFADMYGEYDDEGSWKRKMGAARIASVANAYREQKHEPIFGITDEYRDVQEAQQSAAQYRSTVDTAFNEIGTSLSFAVGKKDSYDYKIPESTIAAVKEAVTKDDVFSLLGKSGVSKEAIGTHIRNAIIVNDLPKIITEVANSHHAAMMGGERMGRRNIVPTTVEGGQQDTATPFRSAVDKVLEEGVV